jgi:hypothetical protein
MSRKSVPPPVVTPEMMQDVYVAHQKLADALPVLAKLDAIGMDTTQWRAMIAHYDQQFTAIKQQFGGKP